MMAHRWELDIRGTDGLLEFLAPSFADGPIVIFQADNGYRIRAEAFDACNTSRDVRNKAIEVATSLAGAGGLLDRRGTLTIGAAYELRSDNRRNVTVFVEPIIIAVKASVDAHLSVIRADGTVEVSRPADQLIPWVRLALTDEAVAKTLRIIANNDQLGWVELYKLCEIIQRDVGAGLYKWASRKQVEKFTRTANSADAAGDDARHAVQHSDPPPKPMSLADARAMWDRVVKAWLASKGST